MSNNVINFYVTKQKRMRVMCAILEKIRGKSAMDLLIQYGIELKPPIDISLLLEQIGISVISKDFSEEEKAANIFAGELLIPETVLLEIHK